VFYSPPSAVFAQQQPTKLISSRVLTQPRNLFPVNRNGIPIQKPIS
jgi:hypothetical protein